MVLNELLKKDRISDVIEMAQAYDYLQTVNMREEEILRLKKMIFDFKVRFITQMDHSG